MSFRTCVESIKGIEFVKTGEEELDLWENGGKAGKDRVIMGAAPYVVRAVCRAADPATTPDRDMEDLFGAGMLGLAKAGERYDPRRESAPSPSSPGGRARFLTYAATWIDREVKEERRRQNNGPFRKTEGTVMDLGAMAEAATDLTSEFGREPDEEEIDARLAAAGMSEFRRKKAFEAKRLGTCLSLDLRDPTGSDGGGNVACLLDAIPDETVGRGAGAAGPIEAADLGKAMAKAMAERLTPTQRFVIEAIFGLGGFREARDAGEPAPTEAEIGAMLAQRGLTKKPVSKQRVDQIRDAAVAKLRKDGGLAECWGSAL